MLIASAGDQPDAVFPSGNLRVTKSPAGPSSQAGGSANPRLG